MHIHYICIIYLYAPTHLIPQLPQDVFDYAVENGCSLFDTAELYGLGRSETLLGNFIERNADARAVQVATKFAALPWRTKASDVVEAAKRGTDRLGRPIDLYQIHFPNAWANDPIHPYEMYVSPFTYTLCHYSTVPHTRPNFCKLSI